MEDVFPSLLTELLIISVTYSVILMALLQKFKSLSFITKSWQIGVLNFIFSFAIGMPFAITFYDVNILDSIWVGLFSFIGASAIYEALKNQKLINYTPTSLSDKITISSENEIKRDI